MKTQTFSHPDTRRILLLAIIATVLLAVFAVIGTMNMKGAMVYTKNCSYGYTLMGNGQCVKTSLNNNFQRGTTGGGTDNPPVVNTGNCNDGYMRVNGTCVLKQIQNPQQPKEEYYQNRCTNGAGLDGRCLRDR